MSNHLTEDRQNELNRISASAKSAREVFQHALGEAFLRFERNIDAELARQVVDAMNDRTQAAKWMAGMLQPEGALSVYEVYLKEGRDSVVKMLKSA